MKQILRNLKTSTTELIDKPCPLPSRHHHIIKTSASRVTAVIPPNVRDWNCRS